jgi:hypothetical protein
MTVFIAIHYTGFETKGLRWVEHVARMGERGIHRGRGFWWGKLQERDNFEDLDLGGGLILKWGLKKQDETA